MKKFLFLALGLLLAFVLYTMVSTGFFRSIESIQKYKILKEIELPGAEDFAISRSDSFAIISSTKRNSYPPEAEEHGGLYFMDLRKKNTSGSAGFQTKLLTGFLTKTFAPHGISIFKTDSSSYKIAAINHTAEEHFIEFFNLNGDTLTFEKTVSNPALISPNDLVLIDENRFYFTNDHFSTEGFGKFSEEYLGFKKGTVFYFDGTDFQQVAEGIAYANGINMDASRQLLYVASPRDFLTKVYQILNDGSLQFQTDIPCGSGVDNIELDETGNLWIGSHPSLLHFNFYNKNLLEKAPSEILKINFESPENYLVEKIYVEDGSTMSGASVAIPFGNFLLAGNVKDEQFLILEK